MSKWTPVEMHAERNVVAFTAEMDRLRREHRELESRICELNGRVYLSPAEEVERKQLQKLKLAKKDRLAVLQGREAGTS